MTNLTLTIISKQGEVEVIVPQGATVMDAIKAAEQQVPHFCYHKRLSIAGNCRMCLVEVEGAPKPVASCHWPANDGMRVNLDSETTINARKGTMELLLANHPLDCPICDQGGECELQDQAVAFGSDRSQFQEMKRAVDDKEIGAKIKTVMTRCIHCMRCVRFATEIAGVEEFGATGRGVDTQVGTYVEEALQSELAGNMIDLCPVGALTNKPYAFTARPWELQHTDSIDVMDGVGTHIRVDHRAGKVMRIVPRECDAINEEWMSDTARFSWDALSTNRLTTPMVRKNGKLTACGWPEAFKKIEQSLKKVGRDKIAGLAGDLHCAEDYYAFNAFMKETLKTDNVDARGDGACVDSTNHAAYIMHTPLADIEKADAVLLIGTNPRHEAPLLNVRLRCLVQSGIPIAMVGEEVDLTYKYKLLGDNPQVLEDIANSKNSFGKILQKAEKPLIILGSNVLTRPDAKAVLFSAASLAEGIGAVTENWRGFNVLQRMAGRVAALDMAVHPVAGGLETKGILKALSENKLDVLFQYGDIEVPCEMLQSTATKIYIGIHLTEQAQTADVMLPAAAYTEKNGLWTNIEGRVQEAKAAVQPPLQAKEDWKIFRALSAELGKPLPFNNQAQLRQAIVDICAIYNEPNMLVQPEWERPGKAGKMKDTPFTLPVTVENYYQTNEILRASNTMVACQAEILEKRKVEEAA
ncbi:MAG: NADH-quinone oxidoreductase subunit NuoG [Alphaproteobacteria bacterium]|nr:NADH-quinone oxidoreductase subunit NuoG [Alphaproteobacteria bacterium]MDD9919741.1 NADH-quinone oxidoreductase subunit NuoG [Alphaproteobacteria bacterium]